MYVIEIQEVLSQQPQCLKTAREYNPNWINSFNMSIKCRTFCANREYLFLEPLIAGMSMFVEDERHMRVILSKRNNKEFRHIGTPLSTSVSSERSANHVEILKSVEITWKYGNQ